MSKKYYLRIYENQGFAFVCDSILEEQDNISELLSSDILIANADYKTYLEAVGNGKVFRLKEKIPDSGNLLGFIEEFTLETPPLTELQQTQIALAETIEKQEIDKLELQLALAELIESTMEGGV